MDIAPTSLTQRKLGRDGREYEISGEAGRIAQRLRELDPSLRVSFNEGGMYFVVYQLLDHAKQPVTLDEHADERTAIRRVPMADWDDRIIHDLEARAYELRHGISRADALDSMDARRQDDLDYEFEQMVKERAYPLFRAFQRGIIGSNPRAFISSGLSR